MKNRELRFRAWDAIKHAMIEDDYLKLHWHECIENSQLKIMQCIGIKDRTNKLIYEGDILHTKIDIEYLASINWRGDYTIISLVYWDYVGFKLYAVGMNDQRFIALKHLEEKDMEIIGNIYQSCALRDIFKTNGFINIHFA